MDSTLNYTSNCDAVQIGFHEVKTANMELKLRLDCQEEIIAETNRLVADEEKLMKEKLEALWEEDISFLNDANKFHDEFGISSPWWNNQISSLANADCIQNSDFLHHEKERELAAQETEIEKLQNQVESQRHEIMQLKMKNSAHDVQIIELQKNEIFLQQEPFGTEFQSLKTKLQRSKETCQQLEAAVSRKPELGRKRLPEPESVNDLSYQSNLPKKIIRTQERTTFVFRQPHRARNGAKPSNLDANIP